MARAIVYKFKFHFSSIEPIADAWGTLWKSDSIYDADDDDDNVSNSVHGSSTWRSDGTQRTREAIGYNINIIYTLIACDFLL